MRWLMRSNSALILPPCFFLLDGTNFASTNKSWVVHTHEAPTTPIVRDV